MFSVDYWPTAARIFFSSEYGSISSRLLHALQHQFGQRAMKGYAESRYHEMSHHCYRNTSEWRTQRPVPVTIHCCGRLHYIKVPKLVTKWVEVSCLSPSSIMSTGPVDVLPHIDITNTFGKRYPANLQEVIPMLNIYVVGAMLIGSFIALTSVSNTFGDLNFRCF